MQVRRFSMGTASNLIRVEPTAQKIQSLEEFLVTTSVDPTHRQYKGFEDDLRGDLNPTHLIEQFFWVEERWLDFPEFFEEYWRLNEIKLREHFHQKFLLLGKEAKRHLEARLYRTLFGFLTEYHAVMLIGHKFSPLGYAVVRGSDLDRVGVDCQIREAVSELLYNIHIFVDSARANRYRSGKLAFKSSNKLEGIHIDFPYRIKPGCIHSLRMLPNGFGVYTEEYVDHLVHVIKNRVAIGRKQLPIDCLRGLLFK
jgi:hypothetical protein